MAAPLGTGRSRERMSLPIGKRGKVCFTDCPNLLAEQIPPNEKIPPTILYRGVTLNKNLKKNGMIAAFSSYLDFLYPMNELM